MEGRHCATGEGSAKSADIRPPPKLAPEPKLATFSFTSLPAASKGSVRDRIPPRSIIAGRADVGPVTSAPTPTSKLSCAFSPLRALVSIGVIFDHLSCATRRERIVPGMPV